MEQMAATTGGPGAPLSPDKLLPKGDPEKTQEELEEEAGQELQETLVERLRGLTGMFPERLQTAAGATFDLSLCGSENVHVFQGILMDWDHFRHDPGSSCCL